MTFKEELLYGLEGLGEFTFKMLTRQLSISRMHYPTLYTTVDRLEKGGYIKKKKRGSVTVMSLTTKGKALLKKPSIAKKRHDGLSTIITFDIPEEKHNARRVLRRYLISRGYTLLQESLLISPDHPTSELKELIQELDIRSDVKIIAGRIEYH